MNGRPALLRLRNAELTYAEVGATSGHLPAGYHHLERRRVIGNGVGDLHSAAELLSSWELHRRSGLSVTADRDRAANEVNLILGIGVGRWRIHAPCRIVYTVDDADRQGFAYGTLPGHPESGEERFTVELLTDRRVELVIIAFSRPATWWSKLGAPIGRLVQSRITQRYLDALRPGD